MDTDALSEVILRKVGEAKQSEDKFDAEATLSDSTIEAGFEDADVINGSLLQILFCGLGIAVGLMLSICLLLVWRFKKVQMCIKKLLNLLFWNFFIRSMLETVIECSLNSFIRLYFVDFSSWWETMSTSYAFTQLVFTFLYSLVLPLFLFCKRKVIATEAFKTRYGALTDQMNTSNSSIRYY